MEALGAIGTILTFVFAVIAILAPIWLYCINVYTRSTRDEVRKTNQQLEELQGLLGIQTGILQKAIEKQATKTPTPAKISPTTEMDCPQCKKHLKYDRKFSGQYKPCPECKKTILLK